MRSLNGQPEEEEEEEEIQWAEEEEGNQAGIPEIYSFSSKTMSFFSSRNPGDEERVDDRRCTENLVLCALCQQGLRPCCWEEEEEEEK